MKSNLIFFLARFGKGGAGNSVFKLCNSLNKKKYRIFVICMNYCAYKKELLKAGVKVKVINVSRALFAVFFLKKIISKIINSRIQDGQLLDSNFSRGEIYLIKISFLNVWKRVRHRRIQYPTAKKNSFS